MTWYCKRSENWILLCYITLNPGRETSMRHSWTFETPKRRSVQFLSIPHSIIVTDTTFNNWVYSNCPWGPSLPIQSVHLISAKEQEGGWGEGGHRLLAINLEVTSRAAPMERNTQWHTGESHRNKRASLPLSLRHIRQTAHLKCSIRH